MSVNHLAAGVAAALVLAFPNRIALGQSPPPPSAEADSLFFAGHWAKAKAAYDAFLAANPTSLQSRLRAGYAALKLERPDEAIPYFNQVVSQAPSGRAPAALAGLAASYALKGQNARALDELVKADSAGYLNFAALDGDKAFASIRGEARFKAVRESVYRRQFPCAADLRSRAFDFWIGEWDAYSNVGARRLAGHSVIERASGGCMILENWTSKPPPWAGPYEGKSMNFFEPSTGKWKQVWAGSANDVTYFENGEYRDGAMRFTYERTNPQGGKVQGNFIFYNLGPNRVRQFQDSSTDGGKTSSVVYDFIYVRRGSGEKP